MAMRDLVANAIIVAVVAVLFALGQCSSAHAHGIPPEFIAGIKRSEGFHPCAYWDVRQNSIGYGTRARSAGECIDEKEADRRFFTEMSAAAAVVDEVNPRLDAGTRAALASLTFNAGPSWASATLGDMIRDGRLRAAQQVFLQYKHAGGTELAGLVARREREVKWFGAIPMRECRMASGYVGLMR